MNLIQIALKEEAANVPETPRSQVGSRNFSMTRTTWAAIALLVVALGALGHFGVSVYDGAEERRVRFSLTADYEREPVCRAGTLEESEKCHGGDKLYFRSGDVNDRIVMEVIATQCSAHYPLVKWSQGVVCTKNAGYDAYQGYDIKKP